MKGIRNKTFEMLTKPLYRRTKDESEAAVMKHIQCYATQLRLDQRSLAILGISKKVNLKAVRETIDRENQWCNDDGDLEHIRYKMVSLELYNVFIFYKDKRYLDIFEELCDKRGVLSSVLLHYGFTKLFGYSDRALMLFLKKWDIPKRSRLPAE